MFQVRTETYSPSNYTLACMGTFGTPKKWTKTTIKKHTLSQVKIPNFARKKLPTFDKENLLEQIRLEKQKSRAAKNSSATLIRPASRPKLKLARPVISQLKLKIEPQSKLFALRREVQSLAFKVQQQKETISAIKRSKKYNRYLQLKTIQDIYRSEIVELKNKIRSYGYQLRQKRKVRCERQQRERDIRVMNKVVVSRLDKANVQLVSAIKDVCFKIQDSKIKLGAQKREKQRLLRDIYELQNKTGKIYIMAKDQVQEEDQEEQPLKQSPSSEKEDEKDYGQFEADSEYASQKSETQQYSEEDSEEFQRRTLSY